MTPTEHIIRINNLTTEFELGGLFYPAVRNVSFEIARGEIFGLAGESGCGKSTAAMTVMHMLPENGRAREGEVLFAGQNLLTVPEAELRKIWWKKIAMIFQGSLSSLNPVRRVGNQIAEVLTVRGGLTRNRAWEKVHELFSLIGIRPDRSRDYPHEFSGGMRQRVMIAMAICLDPGLIIADECTTALDVMIQAQIVNLLKKLNVTLGLSMIFINHDLALVAEICDRVAVMYGGRIVEMGPVRDVFHQPAHPYVRQLVRALPRLEGAVARLKSIPGSPPRLKEQLDGCPFLPRCGEGDRTCALRVPTAVEVSPGHFSACVNLHPSV